MCEELPGLVYGFGGGEGEKWCHTFFVTYLRGSKNLTRRDIGGGEGVSGDKGRGESLSILVNQSIM